MNNDYYLLCERDRLCNIIIAIFPSFSYVIRVFKKFSFKNACFCINRNTNVTRKNTIRQYAILIRYVYSLIFKGPTETFLLQTCRYSSEVPNRLNRARRRAPGDIEKFRRDFRKYARRRGIQNVIETFWMIIFVSYES